MSTITWSVTPSTIQYQQRPVVLMATNVPPNTKFKIRVTSPVDPSYLWTVTSNNAGVIMAKLHLTSGPGRYTFTPEDCNDWAQSPQEVLAVCCVVGVTPPTCNLELYVSRNSVPLGTRVTVDIAGAIPGATLNLFQHSPMGGIISAILTASPSGTATTQIILDSAGVHNFSAAQGVCTAGPVPIVSVGDLNQITNIQAAGCEDVIKVIPRFIVQSVNATSPVSLLITVTNASTSSQVVNLGPLVLPPGLISAFPIQLVNEPVGPSSSRDFYFYLTADNSTEDAIQITLAITPANGNYICGGNTRQIIGGSANLYVAAPPLPCGLQVIQFNFSPNTLVSGQATTLILAVKNIGGATLSNVTLMAMAPPTQLTTGPIEFSGVPLGAGQTYTYSKQFIASSVVDVSAGFIIPIGQITANCQASVVNNTSSNTATVAITGVPAPIPPAPPAPTPSPPAPPAPEPPAGP